jgi:molybdopterin-containing oxidoreductase family membrane subunit
MANTLVSVYDLPSDVSNVVRKLKARGFEDLTTYSPAPFDEIELAEDPKPSGVRAFTLIGGLVGVVTGFGLQIWMAMDWPVKIAGKNFAAIPPMWIIGFELTILFAGILTVVGLIGLGGLYPRKLDEHYSPRFSAEEFGVVVNCEERDVAEVESLMRGHNAKEVTLHDASH